MSKEVAQNQLNELLKLLIDGLKNTSNLVSSQTPDIYKQIVQYNLIESIGLCIIFFIVTCISLIIIFKGMIIVGGLIGAVFSIGFLNSLFSTIQWWIAPKLAVLEYLRSLIE